MLTIPTRPVSSRLTLQADTAADLMSSNPMSIRARATVAEAIAALTDRGYSAAPVIDEAGRAVGVISRADILVHDREHMTHLSPSPERDPKTRRLRGPQGNLPKGFALEEVDPTLVADIMTPVVFSVSPETPAKKVIEQMLAMHVHQLFVVDQHQSLIGVITSLDVLRHLHD
jgi:CBS-domain-containing membrane protein